MIVETGIVLDNPNVQHGRKAQHGYGQPQPAFCDSEPGDACPRIGQRRDDERDAKEGRRGVSYADESRTSCCFFDLDDFVRRASGSAAWCGARRGRAEHGASSSAGADIAHFASPLSTDHEPPYGVPLPRNLFTLVGLQLGLGDVRIAHGDALGEQVRQGADCLGKGIPALLAKGGGGLDRDGEKSAFEVGSDDLVVFLDDFAEAGVVELGVGAEVGEGDVEFGEAAFEEEAGVVGVVGLRGPDGVWVGVEEGGGG